MWQRPRGCTELMDWLYQHVSGPDADGVFARHEFNQLMDDRVRSLNVCAADGTTALHVAVRPAHPSVTRAQQAEILSALLDRGACLYLADRKGETPLAQLPAGDHLEFVVGVVLKHRLDVETEVPSAAPVSASRMLKGGQVGGQALFSTVSEHVLYFLNEGGVWVWDIQADEEYQVYVPGEEYPELSMMRARAQTLKSQRSIAEYNRSTDVADILKEEQELEERIVEFEKEVAIVSSFHNFSAPVRGRHSAQQDRTEWLLCNTGVLIEVTISEKGLVVRPPTASDPADLPVPQLNLEETVGGGMRTRVPSTSSSPRPGVPTALHVSQTRGRALSSRGRGLHSAAQKTPTRSSADKTAKCAGFTDSASVRPVSAPTSPPPPLQLQAAADFVPFSPGQTGSWSPAASPSGDRRQSLGLGTNRRQSLAGAPIGRRQSVKMMKKETELEFAVGARGFNAGCYCDARLGCLLTSVHSQPERLVELHVYRLPLIAKAQFDSIVVNIMDEEWVATACAHSTVTLPEAGLGIVGIEKIGRARYIFFTTGYPVAYDLAQDKFLSLKSSMRPTGPVHAGRALDNQPHRVIHPGKARSVFAQVSAVVEVCELNDDLSVTCLYVVPRDRHADQKYQVAFHPSADSLALLRAGRSQELCSFDMVTHTTSSVCRLPRPSTLVFSGGQIGNKVPDFYIGFSLTGRYLLRYNTTMHVLSIYDWAEVIEDSAAAAGYHNVSFCRAPLEVADNVPKNTPAVRASTAPAPGCSLRGSFSALAVCDVHQTSYVRKNLGGLWAKALAKTRAALRRAARSQLGDQTTSVAGSDSDTFLGAYSFPSPLSAFNFAVTVQLALFGEVRWGSDILSCDSCAPEEGTFKGLRVRVALLFGRPTEQPGGRLKYRAPDADSAVSLLRLCPAGCIAATATERSAVAPYCKYSGEDLLNAPIVEQFAGVHALGHEAPEARVWLFAPSCLASRLPGVVTKPEDKLALLGWDCTAATSGHRPAASALCAR